MSTLSAQYTVCWLPDVSFPFCSIGISDRATGIVIIPYGPSATRRRLIEDAASRDGYFQDPTCVSVCSMWNRLFRSQLERVKHVWGRGNVWTNGPISHWLQHPRVQARINAKVTGGLPGDRFQYFLERYLKGRLPVDRALTLGCGAGELERGLSKYNFARVHVGLDISDHAVQLARDAASKEGISGLQYRLAELNTLQLEPSTYDVAFAVSSIHHVHKLEHLFEQINRALKPDGYFFLDEYIGPTQFQWTDAQLGIMNEQLRKLPAHLTRRASERSAFKTEIVRKSFEHMNAADPSEAIRSGDIVKLMKRYFNVVEFKGYGGSLLHELLYDIAGNFTDQEAGSLELLEELFQLEDELTANGTLPHDFAVIIAGKS